METIYIVEKGIHSDMEITLVTTQLTKAVKNYVDEEEYTWFQEGGSISEWVNGKVVFVFNSLKSGKNNFEEVFLKYLEERDKANG